MTVMTGNGMKFHVSITARAQKHLRSRTARERRIIEKGIQARLAREPTKVSKAVKRLRANPFAEYELRIEDFRVLYNVDETTAQVVVLLIGEKQGNKLIVEGVAFHGHESDRPS